jgi:hypothetical protein
LRWKPTAAIADHLKNGMADKFGGVTLKYMHDGPIDDEYAILEKVRERKRLKQETRMKKKEQLVAA